MSVAMMTIRNGENKLYSYHLALTRDEVIRIAKLARIALTEEEIDRFQVDMSRILDYVDQLNELDTTNIAPTAQVTGLENRLRPDVVDDEFTREEMLASAIDTAEGHIVVKSVFNKAS